MHALENSTFQNSLKKKTIIFFIHIGDLSLWVFCYTPLGKPVDENN